MSEAPTANELFEGALNFPDPDAQERLAALVGLDDHKARLAKMLGLLIHPAQLEAWTRRHHPGASGIARTVLRRPPLVVLAGDVGSGKTELAETIGDAVARQLDTDITLLPLSLSTRGQGRVGEMTQLLSAAFEHTLTYAKRFRGSGDRARGGLILLVDEADALAQSREAAQMHHEDRAGVNAFIRGVDRIANARVPAAVIMCTNRLGALDPAVKRRAADILSFIRPDGDQRRAVLAGPLKSLGLSSGDIEKIIAVTGAIDGRKYGFTFSDLTQRLLPGIVLDAYPGRAVDGARALDVARRMIPTSPFVEREQ